MKALLGSLATPALLPVLAAGTAAGLWTSRFLAESPLYIAHQAGSSARSSRWLSRGLIAAATVGATLAAADMLLV